MSSNNFNDFNNYSLLDSQYEAVSSSVEESIKPASKYIEKQESPSEENEQINYDNSENSTDNYIASKVSGLNKPKSKPQLNRQETIQPQISVQNNEIPIAQKQLKQVRTNVKLKQVTSESKKEQKYGDDNMYESWADTALFLPLSDRLVDPLKDIGLTPNHVTYLSTACTFLSIYYLSIQEVNYAAAAYFLGYLLDCVDGRMARKYNMSSQYGMMIDLVSDNITNIALFSFFIYKHGYLNWFTPLLIFMTYMLGLSYGINEAVASYKATGNDNFFARRQNELGETKNILSNIFLLVTGLSYKTYKQFFPEYNEERIKKWLTLIKHFGTGNYCLFVIALMLTLKW